jgi:nitrogen fixation NifU-like protein
MTSDSIYKSILLDHFHNPRNKGDLKGMDVVRRGSNPRCGDEIEVGINRDNEVVQSVRFRGRGCSICLASASMMSECTTGLSCRQARNLVVQVQRWFGDSKIEEPPDTSLAALAAVRQHPARQKCVMLAWMALEEALCNGNRQSETK